MREKRDALKPLPSDGELLVTFWPAERDHWHECEAEAERRRKMMEDGEQQQGDSGVGGDRGLGEGNGSPYFTISHFARPCLILRADAQARLAQAGTGQPLTKGQRQNRESRSDYWETLADRFNNATVTPQVDMHWAPVGEIDHSLAPKTPVPGGRLKKVWYDMRGPFTIAHTNFEKSGQHNVIVSRFLDVVQGNRHGELYAVSKRCVIMFVVMRVYRGQRVEGLLGLTLRIISQGSGFDEAGGDLRRTPGDQ